MSIDILLDTEIQDLEFDVGELTFITNKDHATLINRDADDQHPISAITGLGDKLDEDVYELDIQRLANSGDSIIAMATCSVPETMFDYIAEKDMFIQEIGFLYNPTGYIKEKEAYTSILNTYLILDNYDNVDVKKISKSASGDSVGTMYYKLSVGKASPVLVDGVLNVRAYAIIRKGTDTFTLYSPSKKYTYGDEITDDIIDRLDGIDSDIETISGEIDGLETSKQDKLTAGTLVDITNNTISIDITSITNSEIDVMFE